MNIGDVFMRVLADMKDFSADIVKKGGPAADKAGTTLGGRMTKGIKGSFSKADLGKSLTAGLGLGAGLGAVNLLSQGLSSMIGFMGDSVSAASDLNETMAKSGKVFGDQSGEISRWGDTTADTLGLSKQSAIAAAAGFGDLFNKMDETRGSSLDMSKNLVTLAADLASFNNLAGGSEEALVKLKAGLAGEAEPLRSVGVFLNEAKVAARAAELGFEKVNGVFTDGAKIAARYSLILEETASAQGDFADTSDDLANTQRRAAAALEDAQAKLGQKLIPIMTEATEAGIGLIDTVVGIADALDTLAQNIPGTAEDTNLLGDAFKTLNLTDISSKLEFAADTIDGLGGSSEEARKLWRSWGLQVEETGGQVDGASDGLVEYKKAAFNSVEAQALAESHADDLGEAVADVGREASEASKRVKESLDNIISNFEAAKAELETLGQGAADAIYDPMIAKGKLAITESDIVKEEAIINSEDRKLAEIDDLEASGKISAKEATARRAELKETVRQSKVRLAELQKDRISLIVELKAYGKLSAGQQTKFIQEMVRKWSRATGAQKQQIAALIAQVARLDEAIRQTYQDYQTRFGSGEQGGPGRQHGGRVMSGRTYAINEQRPGPPEFFTPSVSGRITPAMGELTDVTWAGSGGSTNINLQTYGMPMRAETPSQVVRRIRRASRLGTVSVAPQPGSWEQ